MKTYKILGWFFTLVSPIGFTSYLISNVGEGAFNFWSMSIVLLGILFFISSSVPEKVGQWMQFWLLYVVCLIAILADRDFGDIAVIMGTAIFLGYSYNLVKKFTTLFYGILIFVMYIFGFFFIDGEVMYRFSETSTRALLTIVFMVVVSLGVSSLKGRYK